MKHEYESLKNMEIDWHKELIKNPCVSTNAAYGSSTITIEGINDAIAKLNYPAPIYAPVEDQGVEEWIWVKGYKATDKNMKCRDYQFELDKQFDMPDDAPIVMCSSGFHFCDKLKPVYKYYNVCNGNRFFEVDALVRRWKKDGYYKVEQSNDKMVAKSIRFVRELSIDEIFDAIPDKEVKDWPAEKKELARQTSIEDVRMNMKIAKLVELGYSEAFATYACRNGAYDMACTMGETPNVSMDVKVLTICMVTIGKPRF